MISVNRVVKPGTVVNFVSRNGGSGKFAGHAKNQGASGKTPLELERSWLIAKGGTGASMNELWGSYLATKGFTQGSLKERMKAFFATGTQA